MKAARYCVELIVSGCSQGKEIARKAVTLVRSRMLDSNLSRSQRAFMDVTNKLAYLTLTLKYSIEYRITKNKNKKDLETSLHL